MNKKLFIPCKSENILTFDDGQTITDKFVLLEMAEALAMMDQMALDEKHFELQKIRASLVKQKKYGHLRLVK